MPQAAIGLYNPKNNINVSSVLRAAGCYNASMVITQGRRHKSISPDTAKVYKHLPFISGVKDLFEYIPYDCIPIAVDLISNAVPLYKFVHPKSAFYIFGPEDGTLPKQVIERCKISIFIPTKYCMNLAATVNVVLYDRMAKEMQRSSYFTDGK